DRQAQEILVTIRYNSQKNAGAANTRNGTENVAFPMLAVGTSPDYVQQSALHCRRACCSLEAPDVLV
ncbi:MAG: hypothetical protein OXD42_07310, partial [Rhodospirillaceae bacterium]|nr:hypothetical protein [Rhodospirillaceae bacterium]